MRPKKYRPDYSKLYPGVHISYEVLAFLKKSDRKMESRQPRFLVEGGVAQ